MFQKKIFCPEKKKEKKTVEISFFILLFFSFSILNISGFFSTFPFFFFFFILVFLLLFFFIVFIFFFTVLSLVVVVVVVVVEIKCIFKKTKKHKNSVSFAVRTFFPFSFFVSLIPTFSCEVFFSPFFVFTKRFHHFDVVLFRVGAFPSGLSCLKEPQVIYESTAEGSLPELTVYVVEASVLTPGQWNVRITNTETYVVSYTVELILATYARVLPGTSQPVSLLPGFHGLYRTILDGSDNLLLLSLLSGTPHFPKSSTEKKLLDFFSPVCISSVFVEVFVSFSVFSFLLLFFFFFFFGFAFSLFLGFVP